MKFNSKKKKQEIQEEKNENEIEIIMGDNKKK